ncbi:MAG: ATP-binding protein, partial [Oscillospiraceae bacterium]
MRDNVLATIRKYGMLAQGDRVTVGLSGGADSVALLRVLLELSAPLGFSVWAGHVNHQLRGEESRRD